MAVLQEAAASKDKVLEALDKTAYRLRGKLGESLATLQKFDLPLAEATTSSLEALKEYSQGSITAREKDADAAFPYFQRAIELDPQFAIAYLEIGHYYADLAQIARASEYYSKAFELREHTGKHERLTIASNYYESVTGELDKAAQTYEEDIANYPDDFPAYGNVSLIYSSQGQYAKAVESTRQGMRIAPGELGLYLNLASFTLALNQFKEARQIIDEGRKRKLDHPIFHNTLYGLNFLSGNVAAMDEQQKWLAAQAEYENNGLALASDTAAYNGEMREARDLTQRAMASAIHADNKERAAIWQTIAAQREAASGNPEEAKREAADALKLSPAAPVVAAESALAFAMAGDTARAESLAQDLEKRFPLNTQMQSSWFASGCVSENTRVCAFLSAFCHP